jgi:hypothetical protein
VTPEGKVKEQIKKVLKSLGVFYWMPVMGMQFGTTGASDFICVVQGRVICIEAKATRRNRPTMNQFSFGERVQKAGGVWWVIHDQNVIELPMLLRDFMEELELCSSNSSPPAKPSS